MELRKKIIATAALLSMSCAMTVPSRAEKIIISVYGSSAGGYPHTIALLKGFYKEEGADVDGIIGALPTVREFIAGNLAYGESGLVAVLQARASGADVVPIGCSLRLSDFFYVARKDSKFSDLKNIKGARIVTNAPKSATHMLATMIVERAGLTMQDIQLVTINDFSSMITALQVGAVDIIPVIEPAFSRNKDRFKDLGQIKDLFPPLNETVMISTSKAIKERPEFLRAIIRARIKGIEFIKNNPVEAAQIIAKEYGEDAALVENVIRNVLTHGKDDGVPFWGHGRCGDLAPVNNILKAARAVGVISEDFDVRTILDESLLP